MNKRTIMLVLGLALLVFGGSAVAAPSKNEKNLDREAARLDRTAATPQGETAVVARLGRDFPAAGMRIGALRERGLAYVEIAITLACAQTLPGGASEENVGRILALRQGPPLLGWGVVAKQLGIKLGACVSRVRKVNNEARREMKKDREPAARKGASDASPEKQKAFTGEGKPMKRGRDAE